MFSPPAERRRARAILLLVALLLSGYVAIAIGIVQWSVSRLLFLTIGPTLVYGAVADLRYVEQERTTPGGAEAGQNVKRYVSLWILMGLTITAIGVFQPSEATRALLIFFVFVLIVIGGTDLSSVP